MVVATANRVESIDLVRLRDAGAMTSVRSVVGVSVCGLVLLLKDIERSVRHVAGKSLCQRRVSLVPCARASLGKLLAVCASVVVVVASLE
jgi:hypothetical protein